MTQNIENKSYNKEQHYNRSSALGDKLFDKNSCRLLAKTRISFSLSYSLKQTQTRRCRIASNILFDGQVLVVRTTTPQQTSMSWHRTSSQPDSVGICWKLLILSPFNGKRLYGTKRFACTAGNGKLPQWLFWNKRPSSWDVSEIQISTHA